MFYKVRVKMQSMELMNLASFLSLRMNIGRKKCVLKT